MVILLNALELLMACPLLVMAYLIMCPSQFKLRSEALMIIQVLSLSKSAVKTIFLFIYPQEVAVAFPPLPCIEISPDCRERPPPQGMDVFPSGGIGSFSSAVIKVETAAVLI